ncbi:MAG: hypothetical protein ER33_15295 [Cyanobium sp. CACIAM 14]|nr:MAG: hypothetical protein ER33_15295 [Cyanobium sp. CACIAM 14]
MAAADHSETPLPRPGGPEQAPAQGNPEGADHPHDFEVQKEIHRRIRNDPDYDDWEYGTEPLPHEAWLAKHASASGERPAGT